MVMMTMLIDESAQYHTYLHEVGGQAWLLPQVDECNAIRGSQLQAGGQPVAGDGGAGLEQRDQARQQGAPGSCRGGGHQTRQ